MNTIERSLLVDKLIKLHITCDLSEKDFENIPVNLFEGVSINMINMRYVYGILDFFVQIRDFEFWHLLKTLASDTYITLSTKNCSYDKYITLKLKQIFMTVFRLSIENGYAMTVKRDHKALIKLIDLHIISITHYSIGKYIPSQIYLDNALFIFIDELGLPDAISKYIVRQMMISGITKYYVTFSGIICIDNLTSFVKIGLDEIELVERTKN